MSCFEFLLVLCFLEFTFHLSKCIEFDRDHLLQENSKSLYHPKENDEYHAVHIQTLTKHRSRRSIENDFHLAQFEIDKKKYNFKLRWRRRPVFTFKTPVLTITSALNQKSNYIYKVVDQEDKVFDGVFYEDVDSMASLLAHYDKKQRKTLYNGIFGLGTEKHVVRSISEKWRTIFKSTESYEKLANENNNEHIVYKTENHKKNSRSYFLTVEDPYATKKLEVPLSVLHIKILPVIEYKLFKLLKEDIQETLKYITTFWNAVHMQFKKLDSFEIEINITGVVIATDEHALSFIDRIRDASNSSKVNAYDLLEESRIFFYENFINDTGLTNYDSIFIMTALNTEPTAGMSYIGRICNRLYSTAFIQDDANFLGLYSAIHELGHLLNFFHDGSEGAEDCKPHPKDGVITVMTPYVSKAKSIVWSSCSKKSLEQFIKTKAAKCLREAYRI